MAIKCYHCKGNHTAVADVKACAKGKQTDVVTKVVTAQQAASDAFFAQMDTLKKVAAENPGISIEAGIAKAQAPKVATVVVPEHRAKKAALLGTASTTSTPQPELMTKIQEMAKTTLTLEPVAVTPAVITVKTGQELELGMYQVKNAETGELTIYKVKLNKAGTQKYAEKLSITEKKDWALVDGEWVATKTPKGKFWYAPGMMAKLTSENKMGEAEAKAFHDATKLKYGVDYGFCCVCAKLLTVKKSIQAGIGPTCASKL